MNFAKVLFMLFLVCTLSAATSTILILDASGSMDDTAPGSSERKIDVAKDAAYTLLNNVNSGDEIALIVFYDCNDIQTVVDYTTDMSAIRSALSPIEPYSSTPIADSIIYASGYAQSSGRSNSNIIILTDGEETCGSQSDAIAAAQNVTSYGGVKVINVVGFDIQGSSAGKSLEDIATAGKGQYYSANDSSQLANSLTQAYTGGNSSSCCAPAALLGVVLVGAFLYNRKN